MTTPRRRLDIGPAPVTLESIAATLEQIQTDVAGLKQDMVRVKAAVERMEPELVRLTNGDDALREPLPQPHPCPFFGGTLAPDGLSPGIPWSGPASRRAYFWALPYMIPRVCG